MPKNRDENQKALRAVEKATASKPVKGESLLRSPALKRKLREAKQRIKKSKERAD